MVCKHVNEALKKIGSLGDEANNKNSPLYGGLGPYVKYETAQTYLDAMERWSNERIGDGRGVAFIKKNLIDEYGLLSPFFEKVIDTNVLRDRVLEIINDLEKCNCVDMGDATEALKGQFCEVEDYERLRREKDEEIRQLKERLRLFEANQRFEARQEYSSFMK